MINLIKPSDMAVLLVAVKTEILDDDFADTSFLKQKGFKGRRQKYERGDFNFVGLRVEAEINIPFIAYTNKGATINYHRQYIASGGLWGIESHGRHEYVNGDIHTNTIEGFWSLFKRSIIGVYHSTSKKYLQLYADGSTYKYNTRHYSEAARFNHFLGLGGVRTSHKELTGCEMWLR